MSCDGGDGVHDVYLQTEIQIQFLLFGRVDLSGHFYFLFYKTPKKLKRLRQTESSSETLQQEKLTKSNKYNSKINSLFYIIELIKRERLMLQMSGLHG